MIDAVLYAYQEKQSVLLRTWNVSHNLTRVDRGSVPEGWTMYCHPEGALYFIHYGSVSDPVYFSHHHRSTRNV